MMIKDSGKREHFEGGMVRDTAEGKVDYLLTRDGPMYERWAAHLTAGARKYTKRNWMRASGVLELTRAKESALRHFEQWLRGDTDEDHAAAVFFNINQVEYVLEKNRVVWNPSAEQASQAAGERAPREMTEAERIVHRLKAIQDAVERERALAKPKPLHPPTQQRFNWEEAEEEKPILLGSDGVCGGIKKSSIL